MTEDDDNLTITVLYLSIAEGALLSNLTLRELEGFQPKIIGGHPAALESYPFQVQIFNLGALCSGSIINSWTILTSAHCFDKNKDTIEIMVQTGSRYVYDLKANAYDVAKFVIHNNYNASMQFENDIALIFVEKPIRLGKSTQKALIANTDKWMNVKEKQFIVTGWGWTQYGGPISELGLMVTHLRFVSSKECNRLHKLKITRDMFCLYGEGTRDTCKGDSGGGVLWNGIRHGPSYEVHVARGSGQGCHAITCCMCHYQWDCNTHCQMIVGITSHGDGCAKKHKPSVYTNVYYFRDWIKEQVHLFFKSYCRRYKVRN